MATRVRRLLIGTLLLMVVAALGLTTGSSRSAASPPPGVSSAAELVPFPGAAVARSADDPINRVLAISVDGLNPTAISRLGPKGAPSFHRLMREGAYTLNARTAREQTRTLPNHTGMLTGRRIDDRHRGHGVSFNADRKSRTVHQAAGHYVASVFDVVHDRGGRTAMFTTKKKFALYQRTWNAKGARDRVGVDHGRAKIDRFVVDTNDTRLIGKLNAHLRSAPGTFVFLHISLPDEAGHDHKFMSKRYLSAVKRTDQLLGSVLNTIAARPALRRETLVLLTADHGGTSGSRSHSKASRLQNFRIPFFAWGPGVPRGANLYSMNPSRRSPGKARTTYSGRQPIRNGDLANLATDVLDLPKVPGSQFNANRKLSVVS